MRVLWVFLLTAALAFAARPPRSACSKKTRGRLWPEEANAGRAAAIRLMRTGEVYLCSYGRLRYRWEPLAVNVKTLEAARERAMTPAVPKADDRPPSEQNTLP